MWVLKTNTDAMKPADMMIMVLKLCTASPTHTNTQSFMFLIQILLWYTVFIIVH